MTYRSLSIAEAVRVHTREERARENYRLARNKWLIRRMAWGRSYGPDFREALYERAKWSALAEIIEAAERSEGRAA